MVLGSSLAVFGAWGIVVFGLVRGAGDLPSSSRILVVAGASCWSCFVLPDVSWCAAAARLSILPASQLAARTCLNNLKQIALALHKLPPGERLFPAGIHRRQERQADAQLAGAHTAVPGSGCSLQGLQLHRTLGRAEKQEALGHAPSRCIVCPSDPSADCAGTTQTSYVAVVGPNAAWAGEKSRKLADFGEEPSNTIMLVEVANSGIAWAEPRDLSLDALDAAGGKSPALAMSSNHGRRRGFLLHL